LCLAAKAQHSIFNLGETPGFYRPQKPALKAQFIAGTSSIDRRNLKRTFSACLDANLNSWGDAPG